jgi:hypothetical protein
MLLARYTPSYAIRDRARLFRALLSIPSSTDLATLLLLAPKPVPQAPSPSERRRDLLLGSAALVLGTAAVDGYGALPEWVREGEEPGPGLRDDGAGVGQGGLTAAVGVGVATTAAQRLDEGLAAGAGRKGKSLDAWLDDEETEESSEEESGEEETTDEDEEEEEEESEYETDSEEDERAGLVR